MGCNCKTEKKIDDYLEGSAPLGEKISQKILSYSLKSLAFLIMVVLLPIINLLIIWFMFKTIVLNKNVNIKPLLLSLGKKFQEKEIDDEEEDDFEEIKEEDVVMVNVEDITNMGK